MNSIGLDNKGTKAELIARVEKYLNEQGSGRSQHLCIELVHLEADDLLEEVEDEEEEQKGEEKEPKEVNVTFNNVAIIASCFIFRKKKNPSRKPMNHSKTCKTKIPI